MAKTAGRKTQKRRTGRKQAKGGMWPWYLAGVLSISAAVAYEHRADIMPMAAPFYTASISRIDPLENRPPEKRPLEKRPLERRVVEKRAEKPQQTVMPALALPTPGMRPVEQAALDRDDGRAAARKPGSFYFCTETLENCVVDGGTFWYGRRKIQIADIQPPRIKQAKCDNERKLGSVAKRRLWEILNGGEVHLAGTAGGKSGASAQDAVVTVGEGRSIGDILVSEGLARRNTGGKPGWCAEG